MPASPSASLLLRRPRLLAAIAVLGGILALRAPLWSLPGLGRDEAFYVYWAHHPQLAYAPGLSLLLGLVDAMGAAPAWSWRIPNALLGLIVVFVFERWLRARGATGRERGLAVALFALSPWQTYAGAWVHPDDLQLLAFLGYALAVRRGRPGVALLLAALAPWTKPSGLLLTVVAIAHLLAAAPSGWSRPRVMGVTLTTVVVGGVPLVATDSAMVTTLLGFAALEHTAWPLRLVMLVLGLVAFAGPGPVVAAARGLRSIDPRRLLHDPERLLAVVLLAAFLGAALVTGQVKGNWSMPGVFLLWPVGSARAPRNPAANRRRARLGATLAVAATVVFSSAFVAAFSDPGRMRDVEHAVRLPAYLDVAGRREAEVAPASAWWQRVAEYEDFGPMCTLLDPDDAGSDTEPGAAAVTMVVSDDYGFAAQWAVQCPTDPPRIVLPHDGLVPRADRIARGAYVLAVYGTIEDLVGPEGWTPLAPVPHPITGAPVRRARVIAPIAPATLTPTTVLPPRSPR